MPWFRTAPPVKTEFSQYSDDFYLDNSGVLKKKDIPKDDQAVIDSGFDSRLETILDAYSDVINGSLGYNVEFSDEIVEVNNTRRALDQLLEADQILDEYRSSDPSLKGLTRDKLIASLRGKYDAAVANVLKKQNSESEVVSDEKDKTVEESKQEAV